MTWRAGALTLFAVLASAQPARADWLLTPFAGAAFRTQSGVFDLDDVATRPHATYGAALALFPDRVFGVEAELSWTPSPFTGPDLIEASRVVSGTAGVILALPRRCSRVVRPYAAIGGGLIHVQSSDVAGVFSTSSARPAASAGAGAWVPITARFGIRGDVRFMRTGSEPAASYFERWQATLGAALRF